jgi:hypothetical protein
LSAMPRREQSGHDWNATCAVIRASVSVTRCGHRA